MNDRTLQRPTVVNQMLEFLEEMAQAQGLISKGGLAKYREELLPRAKALADANSAQPEILEDLIRKQHDLKPEEKQQIALLAALESRMLRAIQFYERSSRQRSVKEEFVDNFKTILRNDGIDLDNPSAQVPAQTPNLDAVAKTFATAQIVNVITKHPVEWETDIMRQSEWDLANELKKLMPQMENRKETFGFGERIPSDKFAGIEHWTFDILTKLKDKQDITYFNKNTVPKENASAGIYYDRILKQFDDVVVQYNAALDEVLKSNGIPDAARRTLEGMHVSEERKKTLYSLHTWALSGDGDGRPDSTDIGLFRGVMQGFTHDDKGKEIYKGPVIDMRHNAEEQRNLLSSAIQRKYLDSLYGKRGEPGTFKAICDDFTDGKKTAKGEIYNPDANIYQELTPADQAQFARRLLTNDLPALSLMPGAVKKQVMEFMPFFDEYYTNFLKDHKLPPTTTFGDLRKIPDGGQGDLWGKLRDGVIEETQKRGTAFILNDYGSYSPLKSENYAAYFHGRKTLDDKGEVVTMSEAQRNFDIGIFKRMMVADHFIEQFGSKDKQDHWNSAIFQRYKIANFSSEADFYIAMELFKEAGLITVKKGRVTDVKMGIMPLLETDTDMNNAEKIFSNLLADPLVKSFWEKRGKVEVMVGYSDGSKSAGSRPSQNKIRETKQKLLALFDKAGLELHVHEGPGYGLDRGGVLEAGAVMLRQPPELQERGLYDVTIQGTLPRDMAGYPEYGQHYLASMLTGVMTGAQHAAKMKDPEAALRQKRYDEARSFIFEGATKDFQAFRADNLKDTLRTIAQMPKNPDKNSRPEARPQSDPNEDLAHRYDATRMIGIEYPMRQSKLPFFEIGLKQGLQAFIDSGMEVPDANGNMVSGMRALQVMAEQDEMFRLQMNLAQISMRAYRKDLARQWGQLTNTAKFFDAATEKLDGLAPMIAQIREGGAASRRRTADGSPFVDLKDIRRARTREQMEKERNPALDYFAHATSVSNTLDMLAQTALLSEAYDPAQKKVVSIADTAAKTVNPKNKRKDADRIRMLRNFELCTVAPIETQDMAPLTAEVRKQVEGRVA